jgi:hypothetical protein
MSQPEKFEWEREHSPFTVEGQIESAGAFGRGLARKRTTAGRFFLGGAIFFGVLVVIGIVQSL